MNAAVGCVVFNLPEKVAAVQKAHPEPGAASARPLT
jgi:hypothetical protein